MFCSNCGTEITDTAKFCFKCGNKVYEDTLPEATSNNADNVSGFNDQMHYSEAKETKLVRNERAKIMVHLFWGILSSVIGLGLLFFAINSYNADTGGLFQRYTYTPPFSNHEMGVIIFGIMGIVMSLCGGIDIIFAIVKASATEKSRR